MKLRFGKYQGRDLRNVPADYLRWLRDRDIDDALRAAIEQTLAQWDTMKRPKKQANKQKAPRPFDDVTARFRLFSSKPD